MMAKSGKKSGTLTEWIWKRVFAEDENLARLTGSPSSASWHAGYVRGVIDTYEDLIERPDRVQEKARRYREAWRESRDFAQQLEGISDPGEKGARTLQLERMKRDEEQAASFAALIRAGDTTEMARKKMGIGDVRARRVRAIAVRLGLLQKHQRTRHLSK